MRVLTGFRFPLSDYHTSRCTIDLATKWDFISCLSYYAGKWAFSVSIRLKATAHGSTITSRDSASPNWPLSHMAVYNTPIHWEFVVTMQK